MLVEPFRQFRLGIYVLGLTGAFLVAVSYLVFDAFSAQYQHVMGIFRVVDPELRWELITNDLFYDHALRIGALVLAFVVVLFGVVLRMTHKVYGPLVSVERFVDQMAEGQYHRRVAIRGGDDLPRLVGKLNSMAEALQKRHGAYAGLAELDRRRRGDDLRDGADPSAHGPEGGEGDAGLAKSS